MGNILDAHLRVLPALTEVAIDERALARFAGFLNPDMLNVSEADLLSRQWKLDQAFRLTLVFNSINFCYWAGKGSEKWSIRVGGQTLDGSIALIRLLEEQALLNPDFLDWRHLSGWTLADFENVFSGSNVRIPLLEKRYENLMALSSCIIEEYDGNSNLIFEDAHNHAGKMLEKLCRMPCFEDESVFSGVRVCFWKRAQLQVKTFNDLNLACGGQQLDDLHLLTAFADYKIPQILRHLGILKYSRQLTQLVEGYALIAPDSKLENEIRISTIAAVDKIANRVSVPAALIDSYLWKRASLNKEKMEPYHRTYTSAY